MTQCEGRRVRRNQQRLHETDFDIHIHGKIKKTNVESKIRNKKAFLVSLNLIFGKKKHRAVLVLSVDWSTSMFGARFLIKKNAFSFLVSQIT